MNIASIVGTRPQFLKLSPLCNYLQHNQTNIKHIIIHSGQHFDDNMSKALFKQLKIPKPSVHIRRNNKSREINFGNMLHQFRQHLQRNLINKVIVYGDCDTTLAGAMAANSLGLPVIHVEAGMRSFNKNMPEEINRILTDNVSNLLLCPHQHAVDNLHNENIINNVHLVGNLQVELIHNSLNKIKKNNHKKFSLLTIHRDYNTNSYSLKYILDKLSKVQTKFIFPIHPRTKNIIETNSIRIPSNIIVKEPFSYFDMLQHLYQCDYVVTDSGGLQLESWYLGKKCVVMRTETEWCDAISSGVCALYDYTTELDQFIQSHINSPVTHCYELPVNTSELIVKHVVDYHD